MSPTVKSLRICPNGHKYYKSSDCPVCPVCEKERRPVEEFLSAISAPARRALEGARIKTIEGLSKFSEEQLLKLHGMGPNAIGKLRNVLKSKGLSFSKK